MKKILFISVAIASAFLACYKPPPLDPLIPVIYFRASPDSAYLSVIGKYVRQHPHIADYNTIDFESYRIGKVKNCWYLRLPFRDKPVVTDFIVLQTDSLGLVAEGRIVHLEKTASPLPPPVRGGLGAKSFNGSIVIRNVDQQIIMQSAISNGFVESFHPSLFGTGKKSSDNTKAESFPVPYDELPEVVVVAYLPAASSGSLSFSDCMMLQSLFGGGASGGEGSTTGGDGGSYTGGGNSGPDYGYGVYNPIDYGPYGNGTGGSTITPHEDPNMNLAYDESFFRPAIDLDAWMKCFTDIPDAGASCSLTLLGDLPVDTDPTMGMNLWSGNTGHCFLQLNKSNGSQAVTQIIGFTAQSPLNAVINTESFVPSKTVDNAGHKYNCSITMNLGAAGLGTVIEKMKSLSATMPYSVVNYDCLDYGLEVFNSVRPNNPLIISKKYSTSDPFSNIANGPKLYTLLENMVMSRSLEAANITIDGPRYAGVSHGPCN